MLLHVLIGIIALTVTIGGILQAARRRAPHES